MAVFNLFAVNGVVPNLALIVVVAASDRPRSRSSVPSSVSSPGMLLDLAPPADHVAGRWALALVLVAILAGRVRGDARRSPLAGLATVAVCSFVATSVFALSGVVLGDHALPAGEMIQVIGIALLWDVVVAPLLLPGADGALRADPTGRTGLLMAAVLIRPNASEKSRLRLFVVQALVLALFMTLFARLWYMQVATGRRLPRPGRVAVGARRRGAAGPRAHRRRHGAPAGRQPHQLGGQHRPDPGRQAARGQVRDRTLQQLCRVVHEPYAKIEARILVCGQPGSKTGTCWNGSPYQPVPVARDVPQRVAVKVLEQSEDYPGVLAQQESVRAYPSPYGVNAAHVLGYLSPITEGELDEAKKDDDTSVNGASVVGRAGVEKSYDAWLRGKPGYKKVAVDSMGRVLGDSGEIQSTPGRHPGHLHRRRRAGLRGEAAPPGDDDRARHLRQGHRPQLRRRQRCRGRDGGQDRPHRGDGQPADVRPRGVVRRHLQQGAQAALLRRTPATRCSRGPPRASTPRGRRGSRS